MTAHLSLTTGYTTPPNRGTLTAQRMEQLQRAPLKPRRYARRHWQRSHPAYAAAMQFSSRSEALARQQRRRRVCRKLVFPEDSNSDHDNQPREATMMTDEATRWLTQIEEQSEQRKVVVEDQEQETEMEMMVEWNRMEVCDTARQEKEKETERLTEDGSNTAREVAIPTCIMTDKVLPP